MAGGTFKRSGARGGGFKKAFNKKRASPEDDDNAPRASKKAKNDADDETIPLVPKLEKDDDDNSFVAVSCSLVPIEYTEPVS